MSMRHLINIIDESSIDESLETPFEYKQVDPNIFKFQFETPDKQKHEGQVLFHKHEANRAVLLYEVNGSFEGFNTQGFARQILSTVVTCALTWVKQNPQVQYIQYTAEKDDGTNNRRGVYKLLTNTLCKKYGFKVVINNPGMGKYMIQVR